jgi:cell wall-associated NlpC family hydrolase
VLAACGVLPLGGQDPAPVASRLPGGSRSRAAIRRRAPGAGCRRPARHANPRANDVVLFALGLIETGYRFGGKNPEAGLDCSGMVSYVYEKSADMRLPARRPTWPSGQAGAAEKLKPGDLVFFNTRNKPRSHVGIYIGDDRFVHAPNSRGKVRTESLKKGWFAARFEEGRTYFD